MPSRHLGRLLDHVHLRVADLEASRRSDRAALRALGRELMADEPDHFASNELFVDRADGPASRLHLAFQAAGREAVRSFHAAVLAAGCRDNGGPGERSSGPDYDAAFVLDPDGNTVGAVHHRPARSTPPSRSRPEVERP